MSEPIGRIQVDNELWDIERDPIGSFTITQVGGALSFSVEVADLPDRATFRPIIQAFRAGRILGSNQTREKLHIGVGKLFAA